MQFDLTRMAGDVEHVEREYAPTAFAPGEDYRVAGPVHLAFDVTRSGDRYRLAGRLTAPLELECSRCAEPFPFPVDVGFDLSYLPRSANTGEGEIEIAEEDLGVAYYENEAIDLGQLMREQFYLALPMKPLCREDCKGLCPQCGANLNVAACGCQPRWQDPRLEGLRRLMDQAPPDGTTH